MPSTRDRALLIVELLVPEVRGLPMSDIADRLGIPRTATHRLLADLKEGAASDPRLAAAAQAIEQQWRSLAQAPEHSEAAARWTTTQLVLLAQACLLRRHSPAVVADAFISSRFATPHGGSVFGLMPPMPGGEAAALIERALVV